MFTNRNPDFMRISAADAGRSDGNDTYFEFREGRCFIDGVEVTRVNTDDAECIEIRPQIPAGTLDALWTAINTGDARALRELLGEVA